MHVLDRIEKWLYADKGRVFNMEHASGYEASYLEIRFRNKAGKWFHFSNLDRVPWKDFLQETFEAVLDAEAK